MSHSDRVSIIIPMYNCSGVISQCLDSVAFQSYENLDVILVDDCSTDNTVSVCNAIIMDDKRFQLICAAKNGGPGEARNLGLDAARGDYVLFLDADDWLEKHAVKTLLSALKTKHADLVVSAFDKIQSSPENVLRVVHFTDDHEMSLDEISDYALKYMREPGKYMMFSYCWGRLFKLSVIKKHFLRFVKDMRICEDVLFNFDYMRHGQKAVYVNAPTYHYRFGNPTSAAMVFSLKDNTPLLFYKDIWIAYYGILKFVENFSNNPENETIQQVTRLGHISHSIVLLVRACGCTAREPLLKLVRQMVQDPVVQKNLKYYAPQKGQSRLIPILLRMKFVLLLIFICRYKYNKRYGKKPLTNG